jgi:hypothetical protein
MRHADSVSATEAFPVGAPQVVRKPWTPEFIAIIDAGTAVILKVLARAINSIVKASALNIVEFPRGHIPVAVLAENGVGRAQRRGRCTGDG